MQLSAERMQKKLQRGQTLLAVNYRTLVQQRMGLSDKRVRILCATRINVIP
jgi:hypothetical protein